MNYTFSEILSSSAIGDSLSVINENYLGLNNWVNDIQYSYDNQIIPVIGFFLDNLNYIQDSLTFIQSNSANLNVVNTLVQNNSSKWLNPITTFYPEILPDMVDQPTNVSVYKSTIQEWLNNNFPINNPSMVVPNYIQNQQAIVYFHTYKLRELNNTHNTTSSTTCTTTNSPLYANCVTYSTGTVKCNQVTFHCDDPTTKAPYAITCKQKQDSNCMFTSPYKDISTVDKTTTAKGYITANIQLTYTDRSESLDMIALVFNVVDCAWKFDKCLLP